MCIGQGHIFVRWNLLVKTESSGGAQVSGQDGLLLGVSADETERVLSRAISRDNGQAERVLDSGGSRGGRSDEEGESGELHLDGCVLFVVVERICWFCWFVGDDHSGNDSFDRATSGDYIYLYLSFHFGIFQIPVSNAPAKLCQYSIWGIDSQRSVVILV